MTTKKTTKADPRVHQLAGLLRDVEEKRKELAKVGLELEALKSKASELYKKVHADRSSDLILLASGDVLDISVTPGQIRTLS